jgi:hypothetical protein
MIVRISGEDQYRLDPALDARLNELDSDVLAAVDAGGEERFRDAYSRLLDFVRTNGARVADDDLETSGLILPPPDMSLAEAAADFTGEGLIPD